MLSALRKCLSVDAQPVYLRRGGVEVVAAPELRRDRRLLLPRQLGQLRLRLGPATLTS